MRKFNKKVVVVVAALALVGIGGGTALAYWTSTGSGTGSATTGTNVAWAVTSDTTGDALSPGGPTDTVAVHVKNPGSGVQHLTAVTAVVLNPDKSAWTVPGCSAADYTVSVTVVPVGDVAAGATVDATATITMNNRVNTNQDGCKVASVPLYFAAS